MTTKVTIGQTVAVIHQSIKNRQGAAYITAAKQLNQEVIDVYLDGSVKTSSGDIWKVKPSTSHKGAQFVSVAEATH